MGNRIKIADLLPTGKTNALPSQALADLIGCRSVREYLRREGQGE